MCNNCGTSKADLMIVRREILKRFEQIRVFQFARNKRATDLTVNMTYSKIEMKPYK